MTLEDAPAWEKESIRSFHFVTKSPHILWGEQRKESSLVRRAPERKSGSLPSTEEKGPGDLDESSAKLTVKYISTEDRPALGWKCWALSFNSLHSCVLNGQQLL